MGSESPSKAAMIIAAQACNYYATCSHIFHSNDAAFRQKELTVLAKIFDAELAAEREFLEKAITVCQEAKYHLYDKQDMARVRDMADEALAAYSQSRNPSGGKKGE